MTCLYRFRVDKVKSNANFGKMFGKSMSTFCQAQSGSKKAVCESRTRLTKDIIGRKTAASIRPSPPAEPLPVPAPGGAGAFAGLEKQEPA